VSSNVDGHSGRLSLLGNKPGEKLIHAVPKNAKAVQVPSKQHHGSPQIQHEEQVDLFFAMLTISKEA